MWDNNKRKWSHDSQNRVWTFNQLFFLKVISCSFQTCKGNHALGKLVFHFFSNWIGHDRGDSFPFDFEPNGIPFGSENRMKNCHHDHVQFNMKGKGNIVFPVYGRGPLCAVFCALFIDPFDTQFDLHLFLLRATVIG